MEISTAGGLKPGDYRKHHADSAHFAGLRLGFSVVLRLAGRKERGAND